MSIGEAVKLSVLESMPDPGTVYAILSERHSYAVKAGSSGLTCAESTALSEMADQQREVLGSYHYTLVTGIHSKHVEADSELTDKEIIELSMHDYAFAAERKFRHKTEGQSIEWWRSFVREIDRLVHGPISRMTRIQGE